MRIFLFALFLSLLFLASCNNHDIKPSMSISSVSSKKVASSVPVHGNGIHHSSTPSKKPKKIMGIAPSVMKVKRDTTVMKSKLPIVAPMVKSSISSKKPKKVMGIAPSVMKVKEDTTVMKSKMKVVAPMVKSSISSKKQKKIMGIAPSVMKVKRDTTVMKSKLPIVAAKIKPSTQKSLPIKVISSHHGVENSHHAVMHSQSISSKHPTDLSHHRMRRAASMDKNMGISMTKPKMLKKLNKMKSKAKSARTILLRNIRSLQNGRPLPFGIFAKQTNILSRRTKNE